VKWLYLLLIAAATADVVTRALVPATVEDLSPLVVAVGYGWGNVIFKAVVVAGIIGGAEFCRRVDSIRATAAFVPILAITAWTFGAYTNMTWL
jgi:hypothetical protein